jgi:hypothetical protein
MYNLFYLGKPIYGGWISFTAHLALKHNLPIFKVGNRTESKERDYGYGTTYRNIAVDDIKQYNNIVITAVDKNYYDILHHFPDNTFVVIHDPSEVTKKTSPVLLEHLPRFRIITIRKSVQDYLKARFGFHSEFIIHPFYPYPFHRDPHPSKAVSISRIDFDKHTDIALEANKQLPAKQRISIYGAANLQYVFFKLQGLHFHDYYKGKFDKTFEALNKILHDAKWVVDMSVIKHDGGGTQYSTMESIYQGCALIINKKWVEGFKTKFVDGVNCYIVGNGEELAELIKRDPNTKRVTQEARKLLEPHIRINWVKKLDEFPKIRVRHNKTRKAAKAAKATRGKTRRA